MVKPNRISLFIIAGTILIGLSLSYLYSQTVISHPKEKFKEYRKTIYLKGSRERLNLNLPQDSYLLKIKHIIQKNQPKEVFVNGFQVTPDIYHYIRRRGIIETDYIHLSKEIIKEGGNFIDITFSKNRPPDLDIILSNYRRKIGNDIYVLFSDSENLPSSKIPFKALISISIIFFLILGVGIYLLNKIFSLSTNRLFLYQIYSLTPFLIFLFSLWMGSSLNRLYKIVITPTYFWTFGLLSFFITEGGIVLKKLFQGHKRRDASFIKPQTNKLAFGAIEWVKQREFSDKCILLFMVLLIMCAFLLILKLEPVAEQLANIAYFALATGIIIKFVKFIKEERQKE